MVRIDKRDPYHRCRCGKDIMEVVDVGERPKLLLRCPDCGFSHELLYNYGMYDTYAPRVIVETCNEMAAPYKNLDTARSS